MPAAVTKVPRAEILARLATLENDAARREFLKWHKTSVLILLSAEVMDVMDCLCFWAQRPMLFCMALNVTC